MNYFDFKLPEITQSAAATFINCPQKFVLYYLMGLRTHGINLDMTLGSILHKAWEFILHPKLKILTIQEKKLLANDIIEYEFNKIYEQHTAIHILNPDAVNIACAKGIAMMNAWCDVVGEEVTAYTILATEYKITPATKHQHQHQHHSSLDRMVVLADLLLDLTEETDEHEQIYTGDHKTKRSLYYLNPDLLELDFQAQWYIVGIRHHMQTRAKELGFDTPKEPIGFFYNAVQRPAHQIGQKSIEDYIEVMYNTMVDNPSKYFFTEFINLTEDILDRAKENIQRIVTRMDGLTIDNVYMNTTRCFDFGGCQFKELCKAGAKVWKPKDIPLFAEYANFRKSDTLHDEIAFKEDPNLIALVNKRAKQLLNKRNKSQKNS